MTTTSRKDLAEAQAAYDAAQAEASLYAELWLANVEAKAIKDPRSPAYGDVHRRMNAIMARIEAL
jgi:hypothetical protein